MRWEVPISSRENTATAASQKAPAMFTFIFLIHFDLYTFHIWHLINIQAHLLWVFYILHMIIFNKALI